jgi:osmoprotectant transport system ATP-binding protein
VTDTMIQLENVTKVYPGTEVPAVAELDLTIPRGEVLVLVGPSGCGKSTTLRLINRIIEPSGGRIIFDGEDVTDVNPDLLRRRIGYVIQQIGLFPHRTIAENIATVPNLLGWDAERTSKRVDELLEMVSMDPSVYRSRYPKELSGGQAQRVGVARALGADPEVLLMDEPFGAIDPITRDSLQNEFLRLQAELKKTIVFVTHDVDEAIKMGDRIAILRDQSRVAQFDTPEAILAHPANDFVRDFLGSGAILKGLNLKRVRDLDLEQATTIVNPGTRHEVADAIARSADGWVLTLDQDRKPLRWLDSASLDAADSLDHAGLGVRVRVEPEDTLRDALEQMLQSVTGTAIAVDKSGAYQGLVKIGLLNDFLQEMQRAEAARQSGGGA